MNDLDSRIAIIKKIDRIKQETQKRKNKFYLNPPIAIQEIIEIENEYGITFPSKYRAFITNIGNGGWGLLSLERSLQWLYGEVLKDKLDYSFLRIPFAHTSTYNPDEDPYILELGEKCDRGEIPQSEGDTVYDYLTAGTMTISLEGCVVLVLFW